MEAGVESGAGRRALQSMAGHSEKNRTESSVLNGEVWSESPMGADPSRTSHRTREDFGDTSQFCPSCVTEIMVILIPAFFCRAARRAEETSIPQNGRAEAPIPAVSAFAGVRQRPLTDQSADRAGDKRLSLPCLPCLPPCHQNLRFSTHSSHVGRAPPPRSAPHPPVPPRDPCWRVRELPSPAWRRR